jgi:hypothetical protein
LPEQTSTLLTSAAAGCAGSASTGRKPPEVKSSAAEVAARIRSSDFGVKTTSGRTAASACRRSRWK